MVCHQVCPGVVNSLGTPSAKVYEERGPYLCDHPERWKHPERWTGWKTRQGDDHQAVEGKSKMPHELLQRDSESRFKGSRFWWNHQIWWQLPLAVNTCSTNRADLMTVSPSGQYLCYEPRISGSIPEVRNPEISISPDLRTLSPSGHGWYLCYEPRGSSSIPEFRNPEINISPDLMTVSPSGWYLCYEPRGLGSIPEVRNPEINISPDSITFFAKFEI